MPLRSTSRHHPSSGAFPRSSRRCAGNRPPVLAPPVLHPRDVRPRQVRVRVHLHLFVLRVVRRPGPGSLRRLHRQPLFHEIHPGDHGEALPRQPRQLRRLHPLKQPRNDLRIPGVPGPRHAQPVQPTPAHQRPCPPGCSLYTRTPQRRRRGRRRKDPGRPRDLPQHGHGLFVPRERQRPRRPEPRGHVRRRELHLRVPQQAHPPQLPQRPKRAGPQPIIICIQGRLQRLPRIHPVRRARRDPQKMQRRRAPRIEQPRQHLPHPLEVDPPQPRHHRFLQLRRPLAHVEDARHPLDVAPICRDGRGHEHLPRLPLLQPGLTRLPPRVPPDAHPVDVRLHPLVEPLQIVQVIMRIPRRRAPQDPEKRRLGGVLFSEGINRHARTPEEGPPTWRGRDSDFAVPVAGEPVSSCRRSCPSPSPCRRPRRSPARRSSR